MANSTFSHSSIRASIGVVTKKKYWLNPSRSLISQFDHITKYRIKLHCSAGAIKLITGHHGGATAAKEVSDGISAPATVPDRYRQQLQGLLSRVNVFGYIPFETSQTVSGSGSSASKPDRQTVV